MTDKIILPTAPVRAKYTNPRQFLFYSAPKKGKSSILAYFGLDTHLIFDTEGSTDHIEAVKTETTSVRQFIDTCREVIEAGRPYKYIMVDTVSAIEDFIQPLAIRMYKKSPMGKNFGGKDILGLPNGGGWYWYRKAFFSLIDKAYDCVPEGGSLILVAHLKDKYIKKGDDEVQAKDIDLSGKMKEILCRRVDAIGYFYRDEDGDGRITFKTSDMDNCGTRCRHLDDQDFLISRKNERGDIDTFWEKIYIDKGDKKPKQHNNAS